MPPRLFYILFMVLSAVAFLVVRRLQGTTPEMAVLPRWKRFLVALAAFVGGSLGSKIPFLGEPWLADGKTILSGLIVGYLAVEAVKWAYDIRAKTGDSFALPLAVAIAVGRLGCYFNGCCYGVPTALPWGVDFGDGVLRHPTQIYETLFHLTMAAVLCWIIARGALRLQRLKLYLIAYCCYRFASEFIRPEPPGLFGLTFYQWLALFFAAGLAVHWSIDQRFVPVASLPAADGERLLHETP